MVMDIRAAARLLVRVLLHAVHLRLGAAGDGVQAVAHDPDERKGAERYVAQLGMRDHEFHRLGDTGEGELHVQITVGVEMRPDGLKRQGHKVNDQPGHKRGAVSIKMNRCF